MAAPILGESVTRNCFRRAKRVASVSHSQSRSQHVETVFGRQILFAVASAQIDQLLLKLVALTAGSFEVEYQVLHIQPQLS